MKKRQVVLYIVVMLILFTTSVYATISGELGFNVETQNDIIRPGDEFSITVKLDKLSSTGGIAAIEGYIDINESILEPLTVESIVRDSDGKVKINEDNLLTVYDSDDLSLSTDTGIIFTRETVSEKGDYKVVINLNKPLTSGTNLFKLNFKVKSNAATGEYPSAIVYKLFEVFSDEPLESHELTNKGIKVIINKSGSTVDKDDNETTKNEVKNETQNLVKNETKNETKNEVKNENKNTAKNEAKNEQTQKPSGGDTQQGGQQGGQQGDQQQGSNDDTVSQSNLPKTGYKLIIIPVIAMVVLGFIFYKKYSKYNYHE